MCLARDWMFDWMRNKECSGEIIYRKLHYLDVLVDGLFILCCLLLTQLSSMLFDFFC